MMPVFANRKPDVGAPASTRFSKPLFVKIGAWKLIGAGRKALLSSRPNAPTVVMVVPNAWRTAGGVSGFAAAAANCATSATLTPAATGWLKQVGLDGLINVGWPVRRAKLLAARQLDRSSKSSP